MFARARRSFPLNLPLTVNGFIVCALVIQTLSIAGIMPTQVWTVQPGFALTVCMGLLTISTCILFSLKSLLTQSAAKGTPLATSVASEAASSLPIEPQESASPGADRPIALVVESSRTVQAIIERSLAKAGLQSVCVQDESAARHVLDATKINLLVAEAAIHESDRLAVLRDLCRAKAIPILALTPDPTNAQQDSDVGLSVAMPIVPDELARAALQLIDLPAVEPHAFHSESRPVPPREMPKLEVEPLDARALGDLEKLGGRDFVREIVVQFVGDAAAVLASLTAAVTERDPKAFREQAHALRSCAANVGAQNVYRMCLAWRDLDAQEIALSGSQYMQMLEAEFERVRGALTPMLQQGEASGGADTKAA
ncbi:MAG: Hpt domain-containing protein [Methylobacteriaceae bacterium]|nr:Hpt domain-containing protein [Methylobacteriaceae bacterium]